MSIKNSVRAVGRAFACIGKIAADAVSPWAGSTLPLNPAKLLHVDAMNDLLDQYGQLPATRGAKITALSDLGIQSVSSNCNNIVLAVQWDAVGQSRNLPETLFLKLPCREFATRAFCNLIDVWRLECEFYRNFSADFPVRLPKVYAIATRRSRFVLLQENLHADPSVKLFTNPDMLAGPSLALAKSCVATFAKFHAFYNGTSAAEREARLPLRTHPFLSPAGSQISRIINVMAVTPCQRKAGDIFPADVAALYRLAMAHWDELLAWWYREPLTLIHGDSHQGNFFVSGNDMGMLDFQAAQWGKGIRDVQYFLIDSLPTAVLAVHERELVAHYVDELAANGMLLPFDEVWQQYRAYSFQTLMTIVVSLGLGPLTEKDHVMSEILARAVAAIRRLDFAGWLDQEIIYPARA